LWNVTSISFQAFVGYTLVWVFLLPPTLNWIADRTLSRMPSLVRAAGVAAGLFVAFSGMSSAKEKAKTAPLADVVVLSAPPSASTNPVTQTAPPTCKEVYDLFGPYSKLSNIQKEEKWKSYKGRAFTWTLELQNASENKLSSGFNGDFVCADKERTNLHIEVDYPSDRRSFVLSLQKGQKHEIRGKLVSYKGLGGFTAEDLQ